MGGKHSHCSHADEQGQGQAVQGTLHPWRAREEGPQLGFMGGTYKYPPLPLHGSEVAGIPEMATVRAGHVTLGKPQDLPEPHL